MSIMGTHPNAGRNNASSGEDGQAFPKQSNSFETEMTYSYYLK